MGRKNCRPARRAVTVHFADVTVVSGTQARAVIVSIARPGRGPHHCRHTLVDGGLGAVAQAGRGLARTGAGRLGTSLHLSLIFENFRLCPGKWG